jgi:hypothetical protein
MVDCCQFGGEKMRLILSMAGVCLIVVGVSLCWNASAGATEQAQSLVGGCGTCIKYEDASSGGTVYCDWVTNGDGVVVSCPCIGGSWTIPSMWHCVGSTPSPCVTEPTHGRIDYAPTPTTVDPCRLIPIYHGTPAYCDGQCTISVPGTKSGSGTTCDH